MLSASEAWLREAQMQALVLHFTSFIDPAVR